MNCVIPIPSFKLLVHADVEVTGTGKRHFAFSSH